MALSQKLAQFTKQQEKLQASMAKISAARPAPQAAAPTNKAATASRKAPPAPPTQNSSVPFAQRFSFTTEKEKLQQIATIQRAPVGAQIKRVLDLLLEVCLADGFRRMLRGLPACLSTLKTFVGCWLGVVSPPAALLSSPLPAMLAC